MGIERPSSIARPPEHPIARSRNASMFWLVWLRSLAVNRPQSGLAFAALMLGATVASLLLNVYTDAHRKMEDEFRAYGPNLIIAPPEAQLNAAQLNAVGSNSSPAALPPALLDEDEAEPIQDAPPASLVPAGSQTASVLYAVVLLRPANDQSVSPTTMVAAGSDFPRLRALNPAWKVSGDSNTSSCFLGSHAAERLAVRPGDSVAISGLAATGNTEPDRAAPYVCEVAGLVTSGGSEDNQVFMPLRTLQQIAGVPGRISLVEMHVPGKADQVEAAVQRLARQFPSLEVRPVREIVQSEGRVLTTLRALIVSLASLIIGVVVLCVMATVTTIVLERRKEIAVMKALGASERTVSRLLLAEIGFLGLAGGLVGFVAGALLARRLGVDLFGVALSIDWRTLLPVVAVAVLVAALPALVPISTVRSVDPARALRGE